MPPLNALVELARDLLGGEHGGTSGCLHDDTLALLPRWAAGVYARTDRTITDCALVPGACA